jgi:uncharacterized protein (DUF736 family)
MPQIGQFNRSTSGFTGGIRTVVLDTELAIVPAEPTDARTQGDESTRGQNAPDYRIHIGDEDGPEVGAGWKRTGERAGEFIALVLDDPSFAQPIRANLFRDDDAGNAWSLHWNRLSRRDGKD